MSVTSISSVNQNPTSTLGGLTGATDVNKQQFLNLLVSQLKAQDPFEPVKNEAFLAQLATFSQLEEQQRTSALLGNIADIQRAQLALGGLSQGAGLVGRNVAYIDPANGQTVTGVVASVRFDPRGVLLEVGGQLVPAGNVVLIGGGTPAPTGGTPPTPTGTPPTGTGPTPPPAVPVPPIAYAAAPIAMVAAS